MILLFHVLALLGYGGAWGMQVRAFRAAETDGKSPGLSVILIAVVAHLVALGVYAGQHQALPLVGLGPASSSLALLVVLMTLAAAELYDVRSVALLLLPVALLLLGEAVLVGVEPAAHETAFRGSWFVAHVGTTFLGYAGLALASGAAVMYVLQFRALKRKSFGKIFRYFPSLDALDRVHRLGLGVGFPALTLGLVAGTSWTVTYGAGFDPTDPEVLFGLVTWTTYLAALVVRLPGGRRGRRAAEVTCSAFVLTTGVFLYLRISAGDSPFFL